MPIIISKGQQFFPELAAFMGGWFHQDFDIHGDSLEEVVAAFKAESDPELVRPLLDDIDAFLATGEEGMEDRFQEFFRPDIIPTAFRPTTREFLTALRDELLCGGN
jgi:CdiI immunity protein